MSVVRFTRVASAAAFCLALASVASAAQTELVVGIAGDGYGYDPGEGVYVVQPDLGTWTSVHYEDQALDVAGESRGLWYVLGDGRGNLYVRGSDSWFHDLQSHTIYLGDGPDGYLYGRVYPNRLIRVRAHGTREETLGDVVGPGLTDFATGPDGKLYCLADGDLYTLDVDTLQLTLVADLNQYMNSLGISNDGRFWGIPLWSDKLYSIDPVTGQCTYVMDLPPVPNIFWPLYSLGSEPGPFTPTDQVQLTAPASVTVGQAASFDVSNAPAQSPFVLLVTGQGRGYAYYGAQPLGLARPVHEVAFGTTDPTGAAVVTLVVPPFAAGRSFWFEVVVEDAGGPILHLWDSNTVRVDVQ